MYFITKLVKLKLLKQYLYRLHFVQYMYMYGSVLYYRTIFIQLLEAGIIMH